MSASTSHNITDQTLCAPPSENNAFLEREGSLFDEVPELRDQFKIVERSFHRQYASLYFVRLHKLRPHVLKVAEQRWGKLPDRPQYVPKVLDVTDQRCYIVGTVYVDMPLKPNVLNDLCQESSIVAPPLPRKYKGPDDKVAIEDESGRIELTGPALEHEFWVTGTVVGLLGKETAAGTFDVQEVCLPGIPPQPPLPKQLAPAGSKYVALISGLNIGHDSASDLKTQLLVEYLSGELGSPNMQQLTAKITRVIVAGNSVAKRKIVPEEQKRKKYGYDSTQYDATPVLQLDEIFEEICGTVDLDVMPGAQDPVNRQLPQQPLHPSLFSRSHALSTFRTVTNPYWSKIDDVLFLGTSGQNIDDILRYSDSDEPLNFAERCFFWRHIAPSAPDTLWCYPFQNHDPFVLETSPHVYFVGNQPQFEQSMVEGPDGQKIRVVLVPSFTETGMIVLVDLGTLECTAVRLLDDDAFTAGMMDTYD